MPQGDRVIYWNNVSKACENCHLYMYESVWIATVATRVENKRHKISYVYTIYKFCLESSENISTWKCFISFLET